MTTSPSEIVDRVVRDHLAPIIRARGYKGRGPTWRRSSSEVVHVVQVQRSTYNGPFGARFYLNGAVYAGVLDDILGLPVQDAPREPDCQLRWRADDVGGAARSYDLEPGVDAAALAALAVADLTLLLEALDRIRSVDDLVDVARTQSLAAYEAVYGWYLHTGRPSEAADLRAELRASVSDARRWSILAGRLDAVDELTASRNGLDP